MAVGNSSDVTIFLVLFVKLKDWVENDPSLLETTASEDDGFKTLCRKVYWAGYSLQRREKEERQLFANPVDAKFVQLWREYSKTYQEKISRLIYDIDDLLFSDEPQVQPD